MGKAIRLLRINLTDPSLEPYFTDMREKGHTIEVHPQPEWDLVMGPTCMKMTPMMLDHLPHNLLPDLIKAIRLGVYGKKGNERPLLEEDTFL